MENNEYSAQLLERCLKAKKQNKLSVAQIATQAGMAKSTVQNQLKGRYKIDVDVVGAILLLCPDLSAEWLLRGEGVQTQTQAALLDLARRIDALESRVR